MNKLIILISTFYANIVTSAKKIKLMIMILAMLINPINASIYITKIINNTKQRLAIEYSVGTNIKTLYPKNPSYRGPNLNSWFLYNGIVLNPYLKDDVWHAHLNNGVAIYLEDAYIPTGISYLNDSLNVITFKTGSLSSYSCDATFALIRMYNGYLEKINPLLPENYPPMRIFDEKLIDGSHYTLEIKQISEEVSHKNRINKPVCNVEAFELVFTKNNPS